MALTYQQAVEQTIIGAEQFHEIINGSATSEIVVEDGSKIPSVRKALIDNFYYKDPILWQQGQSELVFNQIRKFTDGTWWIAPNATATNPVVMGVTPYGDPLWKVFSWDRVIDSQKANRKLIERSWAEAGYNVVAGSFQEGATLNTSTDAIINYGSDFGVYSWGGTLPKAVSANSTVAGTGGASPTAWVTTNNETLRGQITTGNLLTSQMSSFTQSGVGAMVRTSHDKMSEFLSVLDFGAAIDGVTNDSIALSSAIAESVISGKPVKIPKGVMITDEITTPPFNIIAEHGAILKLSSTSPQKRILHIIGTGDFSWDSITFSGSGEVGSVAYTIDSVGKCELNDVNVEYFTDRCCVFSQNVTSTSIEGGRYSNCTGSDVLVVKSNNNNITGCGFSDISGHAIRFGRFLSDPAVDSGCNSSVTSCNFNRVLNDPVLCELGAKYVSVSSNTYDKCRNICKIEQVTQDCHSISVVGNTLRRPTGSNGAFTRGVSATNSSLVTVIGNTIDLTGSEVGGMPSNAESGITVGSDCVVSDNTITGGVSIGILVGEYSTCSANIVKDFTNTGIQTGGASTVSGNTVSSTEVGVRAIRVTGADTVVTGNTTKLSGINTIGFSGPTTAQRTIVVGNNFSGATTPISSAGVGSVIASNIV
jgi:hypothetical protein